MIGDWIRALNENAGALQVLFSAVVTAATAVYAALTWRLVAETRRMRRAQTDAKVTVAVETRPEWLNFVDLKLRNEGLGPAFDIKFEVQEINPEGDKDMLKRVHDLGFIRHGVGYLSPGWEMRSFLGSMVGGENKIKTRIQVTASYQNASGERSTDRYVLDFSVFEGIHQLGEPDLHRMAKSLETMSKDLHSVASGFYKLQVITQDKGEYLREQEEWYDKARKSGGEKPPESKSESKPEDA